MPQIVHSGTRAVAHYAAALRYEVSIRNEAYAKAHGLKHQSSYGSQPVVCYEPEGEVPRQLSSADVSRNTRERRVGEAAEEGAYQLTDGAASERTRLLGRAGFLQQLRCAADECVLLPRRS